MKKKRTFGVSPKGALVLRAREEERRRNLPRVQATPEGGLKRVQQNPLLELMAEFPMLPPIDIDVVIDPSVHAALDLALLTVRGGAVTRNKLLPHFECNLVPCNQLFTGKHYITHPENTDLLKQVTDHLISPLKVFDPTWEGKAINVPNGEPDIHFTWDPYASFNDKLQIELIENDNQPVSNWLKSWYPGGVLNEAPDGLSIVNRLGRGYKMRRANARAEVDPRDNNYQDYVDTIRSWYAGDAAPHEHRIYTSEVKMCENLEKLRVYFSEFKERTGIRLSGLDINIGFDADNRFKLMVTEVFYHEQAMLLLEVVTTIPNMRPMGFVRYFKDPGTLKARNESEHDISWTFNTFFSDFNVFGRDQLDQFLDMVVYCLDKGVREDISYFG